MMAPRPNSKSKATGTFSVTGPDVEKNGYDTVNAGLSGALTLGQRAAKELREATYYVRDTANDEVVGRVEAVSDGRVFVLGSARVKAEKEGRVAPFTAPARQAPPTRGASMAKVAGPKEAELRKQREAAAAEKDAKPAGKAAKDKPADTPAPITGKTQAVPPVEDVTGKKNEPKVSKTDVAILAAVAVLKKKKAAMTTEEMITAIEADKSLGEVNKGTMIVMLSKELKAAKPRVKRVGRGTYEAA